MKRGSTENVLLPGRRQLLRYGLSAAALPFLPGCGSSGQAGPGVGQAPAGDPDVGGFAPNGMALPRGLHVSFSDDPRSTRTLTWFTDGLADPGSIIEYGPVTPEMDAADIADAPFPARVVGDVEPVFEVEALTHRATAVGLDPDLPVRYRVGSEGAWSSVRTLRAAPASPEAFRFCHFGDSGVTAPATWVRDGVIAMAPDFLLITGDLSYADGVQPVWDEWFQQMQPLLAHTPMLAVGGNHENKDGNGDGFFSRTTHFSPPAARGWYSFDYGRVHFVASTGGAFISDGRLAAELLFIEQDLLRAALRRAAGEIDFIVFFNHFTIWTDQEGRSPNSPALVALLENILLRYGVDLLAVGHDHIYQRSLPMAFGRANDTGYVQVTQGAGGKSMRGFDPISDWSGADRRRFSFVEYTVEAGRITANTWAVDRPDNSRADAMEIVDSFTIDLRAAGLRNAAANQQARSADVLLHNIEAIEAHTLFRNLGGGRAWRRPWFG